jgi:ADP-ribose pyrophosphatase YjhB (NUDIX family)
LISLVVLAALPGVVSAQEEEAEDACRRWSAEVNNSESYALRVFVFLDDRFPTRVYERQRARLRGSMLTQVPARSRATVELPPGRTMIWIEPVDARFAEQGLGWTESSALVASPQRQTRMRNLRIRTDFRCLDEPR